MRRVLEYHEGCGVPRTLGRTMKDDAWMERMALGRVMLELIKGLDEGEKTVQQFGDSSTMVVTDASTLICRKSDGRYFRFTVTDETEIQLEKMRG